MPGARAASGKGGSRMRVLVTGAFGNIGASSVRELRRQGHQVRAFGRPSRANRRVATSFGSDVELCWGDVRDSNAVAGAVAGQDTLVHMAYILPPEADDHPELAEAVNIGGTRNVIVAARAQQDPPRLLFASTFDIFGFTQDQPPPRRATNPVAATDAYTRHKIEGERMVRESGLTWTILRFADVPPLAMRRPHPIMFRIPLQTRFEVLHTDDAGLAVANALADEASDAVWGRVWLIGGGPTCQVHYRDYVGRMLDILGIGRLPDIAFGDQPFSTDWLDTAESEALLRYQRHSFEQIIGDVAAALGWQCHLIPMVRPLARWWILRMSPYYARAAK